MMGSWRRMGAFLGLVPEDDPGNVDDEAMPVDYPAYQPDRSYRPDYGPLRSRRRAAASPIGGAPMVDGALAVQMSPEPTPAPMPESSAATRPVTVKLTGFGEARVIGERYRDGASVILDMTELTDDDARRVVDFAAGLAFAMRGSIDKVTARVFMLLPPDVEWSAEQRRALVGSSSSR